MHQIIQSIQQYTTTCGSNFKAQHPTDIIKYNLPANASNKTINATIKCFLPQVALKCNMWNNKVQHVKEIIKSNTTKYNKIQLAANASNKTMGATIKCFLPQVTLKSNMWNNKVQHTTDTLKYNLPANASNKTMGLQLSASPIINFKVQRQKNTMKIFINFFQKLKNFCKFF